MAGASRSQRRSVDHVTHRHARRPSRGRHRTVPGYARVGLCESYGRRPIRAGLHGPQATLLSADPARHVSIYLHKCSLGAAGFEKVQPENETLQPAPAGAAPVRRKDAPNQADLRVTADEANTVLSRAYSVCSVSGGPGLVVTLRDRTLHPQASWALFRGTSHSFHETRSTSNVFAGEAPEDRTLIHGFKVDRPAAPRTLPARMRHSFAPGRADCTGCSEYSFHDSFHGWRGLVRRMATDRSHV